MGVHGELNRKDCQVVSGAFAVTTSSLTMETMAVTKALAWLCTQEYTHACILSDSMNMLKKIQTGLVRHEWILSLNASRMTRLTFIFVPGHAGVQGNERADYLADGATITIGPALDISDVINAMRDAYHKDYFDNHQDSASLSRLVDMGVQPGAARNEHYTSGTRRFINQHRLGVISRFTLVELLRRRSEHLWTCPECCDDSPH